MDESDPSVPNSPSEEGSPSHHPLLNGLKRRSTRRSIKNPEADGEALEVQTIQPVSVLVSDSCNFSCKAATVSMGGTRPEPQRIPRVACMADMKDRRGAINCSTA